MGSSAMHALLQDIRKTFPSRIVILDLPPMLLGDDVIAILPHVDCVLLIAAMGISTVPELEECKRHLRSTNVVRVVANKVPVSNKKYY
jgi:Mrp family chromosome partitioning ATPase